MSDQHVIPDGKGGWNVKGAGNSRETVHLNNKVDAENVPVKLLRISIPNLWFIIVMEKSLAKIVTVMTHALSKVS